MSVPGEGLKWGVFNFVIHQSEVLQDGAPTAGRHQVSSLVFPPPNQSSPIFSLLILLSSCLSVLEQGGLLLSL